MSLLVEHYRKSFARFTADNDLSTNETAYLSALARWASHSERAEIVAQTDSFAAKLTSQLTAAVDRDWESYRKLVIPQASLNARSWLSKNGHSVDADAFAADYKTFTSNKLSYDLEREQTRQLAATLSNAQSLSTILKSK